MEIAGQVNNFGFYHNTQSIYCTVEIIEKNIYDEENKFINQFKALSKGQKINFKSTEDNYKELIELLQNRILKIRTSVVEIPRDHKQGTKFIIEKIEKCDILLGN